MFFNSTLNRNIFIKLKILKKTLYEFENNHILRDKKIENSHCHMIRTKTRQLSPLVGVIEQK
jgi:hypothetical protein